MIHAAFIDRIMRDVKALDVWPALRPGGDPGNEADLIPPKIPARVKARHWWRVQVRRELPNEQMVRDRLRAMEERGIVDFTGNDSWKLRRS
jgi:hypothetical protein